MTVNHANTQVQGAEEVEETLVKRTGRFLLIFKTTWWETISTTHIGNDIHIQTTRSIRNVYLNGEVLARQELSAKKEI